MKKLKATTDTDVLNLCDSQLLKNINMKKLSKAALPSAFQESSELFDLDERTTYAEDVSHNSNPLKECPAFQRRERRGYPCSDSRD